MLTMAAATDEPFLEGKLGDGAGGGLTIERRAAAMRHVAGTPAPPLHESKPKEN